MSKRFKPGHIGKLLLQFAQRSSNHMNTVRRVKKIQQPLPTVWRKAITKPLIWRNEETTDYSFDDAFEADKSPFADEYYEADAAAYDDDIYEPSDEPSDEQIDFPAPKKTPPDLKRILELHSEREAQEQNLTPTPKTRPMPVRRKEAPIQAKTNQSSPSKRRAIVQEYSSKSSDDIPSNQEEMNNPNFEEFPEAIDAEIASSADITNDDAPFYETQENDFISAWAKPSKPISADDSETTASQSESPKIDSPSPKQINRKTDDLATAPIKHSASKATIDSDIDDELLFDYDERDYETQPIHAYQNIDMPASASEKPPAQAIPDIRRMLADNNKSDTAFPLNISADKPAESDSGEIAFPFTDNTELPRFEDDNEDYFEPTEAMTAPPATILPKRRASIVELPGFHIPLDSNNDNDDIDNFPTVIDHTPPEPYSQGDKIRQSSPDSIQAKQYDSVPKKPIRPAANNVDRETEQTSPPDSIQAKQYDSAPKKPIRPAANDRDADIEPLSMTENHDNSALHRAISGNQAPRVQPTPLPQTDTDDGRSELLSLLGLPASTEVSGWDDMVANPAPLADNEMPSPTILPSTTQETNINRLPLNEAWQSTDTPQIQRDPNVENIITRAADDDSDAVDAQDMGEAEKSNLDIDKLSQDVYKELRQRLRIENERRGHK